MNLAFKHFSWGSSSFNVDIIKDVDLLLPSTSSNTVDFDFMETFI